MGMNYNSTNWNDHVTQYQNRYEMTNNPDGTVTLLPSDGVIVQNGTPLDAAHLNNMEQGIKNLYDNLSQVTVDLTSQNLNIIGLAIELETLKGATLNGVNDNIEIEKFLNLSDVIIAGGTYDDINHYVYIL